MDKSSIAGKPAPADANLSFSIRFDLDLSGNESMQPITGNCRVGFALGGAVSRRLAEAQAGLGQASACVCAMP